MKNIRIAIDGPSGVGKSTTAKRLAERLGITYIDTGAMFRTLAFFFLERGLDPSDENAVCSALSDVSVDIDYKDGVQHMILCGKDVTDLIRTKDVSSAASVTSQYRAVRNEVLKLEQSLASRQSVVMDGRDIGTVVLPDAELKIFLTASSSERALRRFRELEAAGKLCGQSIQDIEADLNERDIRDSNRAAAPLMVANDAVVIDSTELSADQVEEKIISLIENLP